MQLPIYFFGDTHFKLQKSSQEDKKIEKFSQFLRTISEENNKGSLFIMGDLFDYYFEYKNKTPEYYKEIFTSLKDIRQKGFDIYFIAGNHDYCIGDHLKSHVEDCFLNDTTVEANNKKFYITHGDGILSWDKSYRLLRCILRSKLFIILFSLLPEKMAIKIAKKISHERKDSHYLDQEKINRIHNELETFASEKIKDGFDYIIMGHYHHSYQKKLNNGELILLGECDEKNYNYAVFDGDKLEIKNF